VGKYPDLHICFEIMKNCGLIRIQPIEKGSHFEISEAKVSETILAAFVCLT
jgi:hypothetical protein